MKSKRNLATVGAVLLALGLASCNRDQQPPVDAAGATGEESKKYLLEQEPEGAKDVKLARSEAKDQQQVVVVGRVGGSEKPWVEGLAAFTLVDLSLVPCSEREDDNCPTPWDYCCDLNELPQSKVAVQVVDADGQTLNVDARKLLGIKELQTLVVRGRAKRDEAGNLVVLADGVFVRR